MKYFVIVNPTSGRGLGGRSIATIKQRLDDAKLDYTLVETERRGHAAELAESAVRAGFDAVVCASGDGTINEALNGLLKAKNETGSSAIFGVISIGTGNDFAGGVGISTGLNESIDQLLAGSQQQIDLGIIKGGDFPEGRYFGNGIGIGFDAAVGTSAEKIRWTRGLLAYLIGVIQTVFLYYTPPTLKIQVDDTLIEQKSLMVSIMNGKRMGGGFKMAPNSQANDGKFDLCICESASKARIFGLIPHFLNGTQAGEKEIIMTQGKKILVEAVEGDFPCHADGEMICYNGKSLEISILPNAITIFA